MPISMPSSPLELLQQMIRFDTINSVVSGVADAELPLSNYLEAIATESGFEVRRLPVGGESYNLLVLQEASPGAPWLLFDSHLDTVGVEGMTIDPFGGTIENGRIYGRGACDTKGSGAAMFWALTEYRASGSQPNNVAVMLSVGEERGKLGAHSFVTDALEPLEFRPAGMIVGEPTELKAIVAHNGTVRWRIETEGRAVHSSDPALGRSAISMMVKVVAAIEHDYVARLSTSHSLTGKAQCSINVIEGGTGINVIPDRCEIQIDRRLLPGEDPLRVLPDIESILASLRESDPNLVVRQLEPAIDPALDPSQNEELAGFVCAALADLGLPAAAEGVRFGTNGSTFAEVELPTVVLGPGNIDQAHTSDEWLALDQFESAVGVYRSLMSRPLDVDQ
jgi:acetylornithine deacetylase